ncbi:hypothetical protein APSETT444_001888 [Aspergillus pseudonomiae]
MLGSKPYPAPLVIAPQKSDQHTHTIILLHGRGSNGERFGQVFLESTDIARRLPTVKFVFLTARKRRSTVLKRIPINQWFDNYSLEDPNTRTDLQVDGLEESSRFLRGLIDEETRLLNDDYSHVIIGGLTDPKVSVDLGRHMASTLSEAFGMDVTWKVYEEFGHWYKVPDEIDDVVCFLKEKVGVPCVDVL